MQPNLVDHLGASMVSALVGAGMVVYLALCAAFASRLAGRALAAKGATKWALVLAQYFVALVAAVGLALPWVYLIGHARISFTEVMALLAGCIVAAVFLRVVGALRWRASNDAKA